MRYARILTLAAIIIHTSYSRAETPLLTLDRNLNPAPMNLVQFASDADNLDLEVIGPLVGLPTFPLRADMEVGPDGRVFVSLLGDTVYSIDSCTGDFLGSVSIDGGGIEGLTVSDAGLVYVSQEHSPGGRLWVIDFDSSEVFNFVSGSFEIDAIDFDDQGNLIGQDINQSGRVYRIPLDGLQPVLIATLSVVDIADMTFCKEESAFYFVSDRTTLNGRRLYRLPWLNGAPDGEVEFVKVIGNGQYVGLASFPDFDMDGIGDACDPDIDNDGVPNETDVCPFTAANTAVDAEGRSLGDIDEDCDTDLDDYGLFQQGFTGPRP